MLSFFDEKGWPRLRVGFSPSGLSGLIMSDAQGEDRRQGKENEPTMDRPRECRLEGVEDRTNLLGKSVVIPLKPPPRDTRLAGLLTPHVPEPLPELLRGEAASAAGRLKYPWEPPCVRCGGWPTSTSSPRRLTAEQPQKNGKSRAQYTQIAFKRL